MNPAAIRRPTSAAPLSESILGELERFGVKLGLATTRGLLARWGDPQLSYPVVLVGGTNGKGSTASLLASILGAAGYPCGLFVSPHLESPRERLSLDGRSIGDAQLAALLTRAVETGERHLGHPPSYFEALCVSALEWFAARGAEIAVLEVGLGGRLDATNVCEPTLSVVTHVGLDHQRQLGDSIREIAGEKAGILRQGRPVVTACRGEGLEVIRLHAEKLQAPLVVVDPGEVAVVEEGLRGQLLELAGLRGRYRLSVGLAGEHQQVNVLLAVRAAERLAALGFSRIAGPAIERGVARWRWPGRCEFVELPAQRSALLDAAHNLDGARPLARFLSRHYPGAILVFGALQGKRAPRMVEILSAEVAEVILTRPASTRALPPSALAAQLGAGSDAGGPFTVVESPERALDEALRRAPAHRGRIVVCGSLYLVGALRRHLTELFGVPGPTLGDQPQVSG